MTEEKIGYIRVNGKPLCHHNYIKATHPDGFDVQIICSCTEEESVRMIEALKHSYPDGSSKQVFTAEWIPVSCPRERTMDKVVREYVDLAVLIAALEDNNPFDGFDIVFDETTASAHISFVYSRYTMNPVGFHIGYETYEAKVNLVLKRRGIETNPIQKSEFIHNDLYNIHGRYSDYLVDLATFNVVILDHPESEECDCEDLSECECELYYGPDEDFAYDEMYHKLFDDVMQRPISWSFVDGRWVIMDHATGNILHDVKDVEND